MITEKGVETNGTAQGALMNSRGGGSSAIFGPDGRRLTDPVDSGTETILYADLDMDQIIKNKMFADCTGHYSRPDLMWLTVDKSIKMPALSNDSVRKSETGIAIAVENEAN